MFSVQDAVQCAERIGYPVMLKASEGRGREKLVDGQGGGSRGVPQLSNGIKFVLTCYLCHPLYEST